LKKDNICENKGCNNSTFWHYAIVEGKKVCIPCVKKMGYE